MHHNVFKLNIIFLFRPAINVLCKSLSQERCDPTVLRWFSDLNKNTSLWLVHIPHCEADQVGSLGINSMAVHGPGGIGDARSFWIVHI